MKVCLHCGKVFTAPDIQEIHQNSCRNKTKESVATELSEKLIILASYLAKITDEDIVSARDISPEAQDKLSMLSGFFECWFDEV